MHIMNEHFSLKKYDPIAVGKEAEAKYANGELEEAQMIYQSALLEWQDDVREMGDHCDAMQLEQIRHAIASLWLSYANFNRQVKQYKTCLEAYEGAVHDEVVQYMGRIWLDYARYLEEKNKYASAQQIYIRALAGGVDNKGAVADETDREILWQEFLRMMQERKHNPSLTLEELMAAVQEEIKVKETDGGGSSTNNSSSTKGKHMTISNVEDTLESDSTLLTSDHVIYNTSVGTDFGETSGRKRAKVQPASVLSAEELKMTKQYIDSQCDFLMQSIQGMPPEVQAAWMASDGNTSPSRPEPLFGPSPPKLSDASGKDIIGLDHALHLIQLLLNTGSDGVSGTDFNGTILLQICKACWAMYAFKEAEFAKALADVDQEMKESFETLETKLIARESVAGAASEAVKQVNQKERDDFLMSCNLHRQQLLDYYAWEFRNILYTQQQLLTIAKVPFFQGPSVDEATILFQSKICSVLHSAFVVRGKVGEVAHRALLMKLEERLRKEVSPKASNEPPSYTKTAALPSPMIPQGMVVMPITGQSPAMTVVMPQQQQVSSAQFVPSYAQTQLTTAMVQQQQYLGQYVPSIPSSQLLPPPPFLPPPPPLIPIAPASSSLSQPPQSMGFQQQHVNHFQANR